MDDSLNFQKIIQKADTVRSASGVGDNSSQQRLFYQRSRKPKQQNLGDQEIKPEPLDPLELYDQKEKKKKVGGSDQGKSIDFKV